MDTLIPEFRIATATLDRISTDKNKVSQRYDDQRRAINNSYGDKIRELERIKCNKLSVIEAKKKGEIDALSAEASGHIQTTTKVDRYLHFIRLRISNAFKAEAPKITYRKDPHSMSPGMETAIPMATLRDDLYNKVFLYIIPNKKAVNKFSLVIQGQCTLLGAEDVWKGRIELNIKDAPTEEELIGYMNRNMEKIQVKINLSVLDQLAVEYAEAVKFFEDPIWKTFYVERRMDYYRHRVSGGTSNQEYKDLAEIFKVFKKCQKDLPLLIGSIKSDEGKEFLEYMLKQP